jgi:hypothetical protein
VLTVLAIAVATPTPPVEEQAMIFTCFEEWLPEQSLKPSLLMDYNTVKHDTDRQVRTAVRKRGRNGAGSGWEVPLRRDSSVSFESRGLPVLTQNVELTLSPWRSNTATEAVQGPAKISETGGESI